MIAAGYVSTKLAVDMYIITSDPLTVWMLRIWLWLHRLKRPILYATLYDETERAEFKLRALEERGVTWFYEKSGYQSAYITARTATHVVLMQ